MVARDRTFAPGHLTSDNRLPLKLFEMNVVWDMNSPGPDESCVRHMCPDLPIGRETFTVVDVLNRILKRQQRCGLWLLSVLQQLVIRPCRCA